MSTRISTNGRSKRDRLKIGAAKRLLRSRVALRLTRMAMQRRTTDKPHDRIAWCFFLKLAEHLYTDHHTPGVWANIFVPSELVWGLGLIPFFPETAAGISAGLGLSRLGLETADALGYPVDLCTFNRCAAGLDAAGFFPQADACLATSNVCDVSSQMLAGFAHTKRRSFRLLDVPQSEDEAALTYLTSQLKELVDRWTKELGIVFDPDRMRETLRLSNQARELALEVAALRQTQPAPLRGSSMLGQLGVLTSVFGHPDGVEYYRALRDYTRDRIQRAEPEQVMQNTRLYWMHLRPYFPTELLQHLEDDLGAAIAFEETSTIWWDPLDEKQPLRSLARKTLSMYLNGPVERRVELALRHIRRYQCDGAVHFSHWGCRQSSGALRVFQRRLRRAGVPLLVLDGDCVDPTNLQLGPLRTRVEAFCEMLA